MPLTAKERKFWNVLKYEYDRNKELRTQEDIVRALKISQRLGKVIDPLGKYIFKLADQVINRKGFNRYFYAGDMQSYAVLLMLKSIMRFNLKQDRNPYAFLISCCHSACVNYIHKERRQHTIKEEMLDRVKHGQGIN